MGEYWYRFVDISARQGSSRCGFAVILSKAYVDSVKEPINAELLEEKISEIEIPGAGKAGLDFKMHEENPNLLFGINCNIGRYGLDIRPDGSAFFADPDNEVVYFTHNCNNPSQRYALEIAFLLWAELIEMAHDE